MPKRILVRDDQRDRAFEWCVEGTETIVGLLELIAQTDGSTEGIELVDELSGQPIPDGTTAEALQDSRVSVRRGFVGDAEAQLALLRAQYEGRFDFRRLSHSSLFLLDFGLGGFSEQETSGTRRVVISGRHQALMYLPVGFPDQRPILIWLTPIFHPNLRAQRQIWPPAFSWEERPLVTSLVGALIETLVGLRLDSGRFRGLLGGRVGSRRASSWFRKNQTAISAFGETQLFSAASPWGVFPLDLPGADWRLIGPLAGATPLVFLSKAAMRAVSSEGFGPGWLMGTRGSGRGDGWLYVDGVFPSDVGRPRPEAAVGVFHSENDRFAEQAGAGSFLIVSVGADRPGASLRLGNRELAGHFVGPLGTADTDGSELPKIRVDAEKTTFDQEVEAVPAVGAVNCGVLVAVESSAGECPSCGGPLTGQQEWHDCPGCGIPAHGACRTRLAGCPAVACEESPLGFT